MLTIYLVLTGWTSWNVRIPSDSDLNFSETRQLMRATADRSFPVHAMCSTAQEDGNAYIQGQILEYGYLVRGASRCELLSGQTIPADHRWLTRGTAIEYEILRKYHREQDLQPTEHPAARPNRHRRSRRMYGAIYPAEVPNKDIGGWETEATKPPGS